VIKAFNKRFPRSRWRWCAHPGPAHHSHQDRGRAGKLSADLVNHSDRGLMLEIENLFRDYAPPNAADYLPTCWHRQNSGTQATLGWAIAYNSAIVKESA